MKTSRIMTGLVAVALWFGSVNAKAAEIELALLIDGSGSIGLGDFALQRDAYVNVLNSLIPTDGSIAIGVWQFSTGFQQEFATTVIDSGAALNSLISAISGMTQLSGMTNIGDTITAAAHDLLSNNILSSKQIIDVSTDGAWNMGIDPAIATTDAIAAGIEAVNCIGIGPYADCGFIGANGFELYASSFLDFEVALTRKIAIETGQEIPGVPEPATLALMGLGLAGLSFASKRKSK